MSLLFNWKLVLSQTTDRSMYQQITDQIHQHVALGDLPEGTKLPSMRELASMLKVSMITVKRAYLELERAGIIVTQHGKGSWVAKGLDPRHLQYEEMGMHLKRAAELAATLNIPPAELTAMLAKKFND